MMFYAIKLYIKCLNWWTKVASWSWLTTIVLIPMQILTDWQDKKGDKRFLKIGKDPDPAATSRHKPKKQKLDGKGSHQPGPGPGRPKSKNLQSKVQEYEFTDDPQDIPRVPKNDAPNR